MSEQNALYGILADIRRAARHIELEWPNVVTADDVEQEIVLRLLTDNYVEATVNLEPAQRRRLLYRIGQQVASGERVDYEYFTGNYRYSAAEVRAYLDKGALVTTGLVDDGYLVEFQVEHVDIRQAFEELTFDQKGVLLERFVFNTYEGTSGQPITRAVDALTRELNRAYKRAYEQYEGPGSRKALSNAQARYVSAKQNDHGSSAHFSRSNFE